jgi:hypothetical protein
MHAFSWARTSNDAPLLPPALREPDAGPAGDLEATMNDNRALATVIAGGLSLAFFLLRAACAPTASDAMKAMRTMGFRDIAIVGSHEWAPNFNGCAEDDAVAHEATATNSAGEKAQVVVCCGMWLKGCTVRTR